MSWTPGHRTENPKTGVLFLGSGSCKIGSGAKSSAENTTFGLKSEPWEGLLKPISVFVCLAFSKGPYFYVFVSVFVLASLKKYISWGWQLFPGPCLYSMILFPVPLPVHWRTHLRRVTLRRMDVKLPTFRMLACRPRSASHRA